GGAPAVEQGSVGLRPGPVRRTRGGRPGPGEDRAAGVALGRSGDDAGRPARAEGGRRGAGPRRPEGEARAAQAGPGRGGLRQRRATSRIVKEVLDNWDKTIVRRRLEQIRQPETFTAPVQVKSVDVATVAESGGSVWARLFPFLLVMMSLTGAFYPAVDLCAGEKERGTMETLLISPATRAEIVIGKFLTVMLASVLTALLNLVSMGLTGIQMAQLAGAGGGAGHIPRETGRRLAATAAIAPPTLQSALWMILLLIPLAAFFSAICVALAVLARSMKEGQYYMTPLYLVCLPLIF